MAADTAQFVGIFCSEKENINLKILIGNKKSNYGCSNTLNILHIQRKCQIMGATDQHFEGTLRYLKIGTFLFLNQEIDILLSILMV